MEYLSIEYKRLKVGAKIDKSSALASLSPFLDNYNLIRVGGRLQQFYLSYDQHHPFVLHLKHQLSRLIICHLDEVYFHAGPQMLRSVIKNQFWILRINSAIRYAILHSNKCIRVKAETRT